MSAPPQIFVRNRQLKTWGPLEPGTIGLMIDAGVIDLPVQVSLDGVAFADPSRFPAKFRDFFPPELGGSAPGVVLPQETAAPTGPPVITPSGEGPGPGSAAFAGPGARSAAEARPSPGSPGAPANRPAGPPTIRPPAPVIAPPVMAPAPPGASRPPIPPTAVAPVIAPPMMSPAPPGASRPPMPPPVVAPGITPPVMASVPPGASRPSGVPVVAPTSAAPPVASPPASAAPPRPAASSAPTLPSSGDLAKTSAIHLYYLAAAQDQTGLLTLKLADRAIEVHFRKGNPEYVGSSHPDDSLGKFLLGQKLVTAEQLAQAEGAKEKFGGELVSALFGLGTLNPATAFAQLAQRATMLLLRGLYAEGGTFTFEAKDLPPHRALPIGNRWAPLLELMRRVPVSDLRRKLQGQVDRPVMKTGGRLPLSELRLTAQETRALGHFDGVRSLAQLTAAAPQDADNLLRLAFLLRDLEALSFSSEPAAARPAPGPTPTGAPAPAAAPRPAPAPSAPAGVSRPPVPPGASRPPVPPGATRPPMAPGSRPPAPPTRAPAPPAPAAALSPEAELKELRAKAASLKDTDHFQLLGVPQTADASAVKLAYFKLAKAYHPDTISAGTSPEIAKLKETIFSKVGEAYRTLSDDKARAEYIEELKSGGGSVDVAKILAAEELFQKGMILVKARKFPEAVKMLDEAIAANGEEGEFYAWRGYAKFFTYPDKKQGKVEAEKDIQIALKRNERIVQGHFFLGNIAKLSGDATGALKHFKRTLELQPDHIDAQREVRMANPKK